MYKDSPSTTSAKGFVYAIAQCRTRKKSPRDHRRGLRYADGIRRLDDNAAPYRGTKKRPMARLPPTDAGLGAPLPSR